MAITRAGTRFASCRFIAVWAVALAWSAVASAGVLLETLPEHPAGVAWPTDDWPEGELPEGLDRSKFEVAIDDLFSTTGRDGVPDTRAVLFVHGGRLVYERYAPGFGPESRFQSWSMAKSVTNAFVGMLVKDGRLDLDAPAAVAVWSEAGDPRRAITLRHLLQMRSGLDNGDGFDAAEMDEMFVSQMLFGEGSTSPAAYAADVPLAYPVGEHWAYSTGTSILIAQIAGRQIGNRPADTLAFLRSRLFDLIGMRSAQPEFARSGEFIGGAFVHATARDWARFGYLYLRDGVWDDERLLPPGWVDFSRSQSPASNNGVHGAHFWVNRSPGKGQWAILPGVPESAFTAEGAMFQTVAMMPTMDLVAVRLGEAHGADHDELRRKFSRVITTFPDGVEGTP